jgi:GNAT superfamily N-acetyltransferase
MRGEETYNLSLQSQANFHQRPAWRIIGAVGGKIDRSHMIELRSWPKHAVPREIAVQIRSFMRMQWPFLNGRGNRIWDFPAREGEPTTFALVDDEILVSHTEVNYRDIEFDGQILKVGGLSAVFTYPAFRGSGCAKRIVTAATDALRASDADLAMLFCGAPLEGFYASCGWTPMKTARVMYGERDHPKLKDDNVVLMLFVSQRGRRSQEMLLREQIYVGANTW